MEYRKCGNFNSKNDSRPCMGASAFLKSVDFTAFGINVKTIAPTQKLYQSGHAIWGGDIPYVVRTFLEQYDLDGKTVVPFCTHGGSRFGSSLGTLEGLCPDSEILEGYEVSGNSAENVEDDVSDWLREIEIVK